MSQLSNDFDKDDIATINLFELLDLLDHFGFVFSKSTLTWVHYFLEI